MQIRSQTDLWKAVGRNVLAAEAGEITIGKEKVKFPVG